MHVEEIEGVGPAHASSLVAAGTPSVEELLTKGATPDGRAALAEATGISHKLILTWVNHADLMRIKGVGPEYSDLLEVAGVDSPAELAQRNPAHLAITLQEVVAARPNIVRRVPTEAEITDWIAESKTLPKVVHHGGGHSPAGAPATSAPEATEPASAPASAPAWAPEPAPAAAPAAVSAPAPAWASAPPPAAPVDAPAPTWPPTPAAPAAPAPAPAPAAVSAPAPTAAPAGHFVASTAAPKRGILARIKAMFGM